MQPLNYPFIKHLIKVTIKVEHLLQAYIDDEHYYKR